MLSLAPLSPPITPRPAAPTLCAHCSLPVPAGLIREAAQHQFCCHACETVHGVINACGLDAYYKLRDSFETESGPAKTTGRGYAEFDNPAFHRLYVKPAPGGLLQTELFLEGLHCAACVWLVEKLPMIAAGVIEARLDFRRATLHITWDPQQISLARIGRAIDSLGYPPHPARDVAAREARRREERRHLVRIAIAGAATGNTMLLAFALYGGAFHGMEHQYETLLRWMSMLIGVVCLFWPGATFFRGAWASIRTRTPHLDLPIAVALGTGAIWGMINTIRGAGEIYYDSLTVLVFMLLVGRWIQYRQGRWAADSVELLFSMTPTSARRIEASGAVAEIPIDAVQIGDTLEVRAGESIPADGAVLSGSSAVDQSMLSGESRPVRILEGDPVSAGAVNLSSAIRIRVAATGEDTRIGRLMQMVSSASARRAPIVRLADRIGGWFVIIVLILASATLLYWLRNDPAHAVDHAVAVLIIACPCALGLATPMAVTVAIARAARRKVLIKGGDALERLSKPGTVLLDKTGTLTEGRTALVWWRGPDELKPLIAAVESQSSHPIAKALVAAFSDESTTREPPRIQIAQTLGGGIAGAIDGGQILVGSPAFLQRSGIQIPAAASADIARATGETLTPVAVAFAGRYAGTAALGDRLRHDSARALEQLRAAGWRTAILSGDHPDVVAAIGAQLGIPPEDCHGGASPEDKLIAVARAKARGTVVMIGDGVNDAAALAAADVGIAVQGGAEASLAAADIYLSTPGLAPIAELVSASRRTIRAIYRCMVVSICYNSITVSMAMSGLITPWLAAIFMPISSITVLAIAYRTCTFAGKPRRTPAAEAGHNPVHAGALPCP